ncbi:MAG: hypothetical protein CMI63_09255 [Parvularcula sp.]|nr:hypothetical protein [Parvularcula sp.]
MADAAAEHRLAPAAVGIGALSSKDPASFRLHQQADIGEQFLRSLNAEGGHDQDAATAHRLLHKTGED